MADVLNLNAASGRNMIGDDTTPNLTLESTSSGEVLKLQNAGGTGIQLSMVSAPTTALKIASAKGGAVIQSGATEGLPLHVGHSVIGSVTVAPLRITASGVSQAAIELQGGLITAAAYLGSGGSITKALRVKQGDTYYVIPVMPDIATS